MSIMTRIDENAKNVKLDVKDEKILELLAEDSRISFQQIAKELRISRDIASYRIKKLIEREVISKFSLKLDYSDFNYSKFIVLLQLTELSEEKEKEISLFIKKNKELVEAVKYFDKWDYLFVVQCKDMSELEAIINSFNKTFGFYVIDQEVLYLITDYSTSKSKETFDEKDIELLNTLLKNSRTSAVELGSFCNLSPDAILYRLKKYSKFKFTIFSNNNKLGFHTYDVLFSMRFFDKMQEAKLRTFLETQKEIRDTYRLLGNWNLFMRIAVENPIQLHTIIRKFRTLFAGNVKDFDVIQAFKEIKNKPFL